MQTSVGRGVETPGVDRHQAAGPSGSRQLGRWTITRQQVFDQVADGCKLFTLYSLHCSHQLCWMYYCYSLS